jgi:murein DD-endopeptidase MepM/ murein hydrolase activator NlpD
MKQHLVEWGVGAACAAALGAGLIVVGVNARPSAAAVTTPTAAADPRLLVASYTSADQFLTVQRDVQHLEVQRNDTLMDVLDRAGVPHEDANGAVVAASRLVDLRYVKPGDEITAWTETDGAGVMHLTGVSLRPAVERQVLVNRDSTGAWISRDLIAHMDAGFATVRGQIETSIYDAALAAGAGDQQVVDFATIFGYDIDFQREIWAGDKFEITYETFRDERGQPVRSGNVIYAEIDSQALHKGFYRFTTSDDGGTDYYTADGQSATKFLMRTPINGARLSSGFGNRRHPILGYNRLHKGTDFAAPTGTPIYAAGNGTLVKYGPNGTFGNYAMIRHANGYETAYAHMSRFSSGLARGSHVRQGQVIGYVGTTGRSTGPHLHYEVHINGNAVNAMALRLPTGRTLSGAQLDAFKAERARIDQIRAGAHAPDQRPQMLARADEAAHPAGPQPIPVGASPADEVRELDTAVIPN